MRHKHYLKNAQVSMTLEAVDLSSLDLQFTIEGGYKDVAHVNSDFSEILEKQEGAADTLIAMGMALLAAEEE